MKESNILAGNVAYSSLGRKLWLDTKGKYMKESNTHAGNALYNSLRRDILLNTRSQISLWAMQLSSS